MKSKSKRSVRKANANRKRIVAKARYINGLKISAKFFKKTDTESSSAFQFEETNKVVEKAKSFLKNKYEIYDDHQQSKEPNSEKQHLLNALIDHSEKKCGRKRIPNLTPEQDETIRQMYRERKMMVNTLPVIELREAGQEASLTLNNETRYPVFYPDIVKVLTHVQNNRYSTRWMHVKKASKLINTIILVIEGVGLAEYESEINSCPSLKSYSVAVEFVSPFTYGESFESGLASRLNVQPTDDNSESECQNEKFSPQEDDLDVPLNSMFAIKRKNDGNYSHNSTITMGNRKRLYEVTNFEEESNIEAALPISLHEQDAFSRLDLVLTPSEMAREKYPLPFIAKYRCYVKTKKEYAEVTDKSPMFGLDCEMCQTQVGSELTRVSVINELHEVVYERLVKPYNRIINYLTKFSGITAAMLRDVKTRLPDVQHELQKLLPPDAILVGQSLNFDLIALQMMHPYVIDTSVSFNMSGDPFRKTKLAVLSAEFLSESIQQVSKDKLGHDSIEDSLAALKLAQIKLKHSLEWGNAALGYKRTNAESEKARLLLLENEKNRKPVKYRLAKNALVDEHEIFEPPLPDTQQWTSLNENEISNISQSKENPSKRLKLKVIKNKDPNKKHYCEYSEAVIISSPDTLESYKTYIPESTLERVTFHEAEKNSKAVKKILELDSEEENKRVIIAHLQSSTLSKVEKLSAKLITGCRENSLICLCLAGSKDDDVCRGTFLATVPAIKKLPPMKQVIDEYLESQGVEPTNT